MTLDLVTDKKGFKNLLQTNILYFEKKKKEKQATSPPPKKKQRFKIKM